MITVCILQNYKWRKILVNLKSKYVASYIGRETFGESFTIIMIS